MSVVDSERELGVVLARVETIREGDEVLLAGFLGLRQVVELEEYDDDTYVVVYADSVMHSWSNGRWEQTVGQYEKGLKTMRRGDRYPIRRTSRGQGA